MPGYQDLIRLVRGPVPDKPLPAIWDFFPCHAGAVGGVSNFMDYYFDVELKLYLQLTLKRLLPGALILPGVFPDLGVVVEASAFGGQMSWFENGAPYIYPVLRDLRAVDSLKMPPVGLAGLMPLALAQREVMSRKLGEKGIEMERWASSMGPAEVCGLLLGYDKYYLALYDDPERLSKLMGMVTEMIISWLRKQEAEYGGIEVLCIGDHVPHQVHPAHMKEFILPCMRAIFSSFPGAVRIYHNEGFHSDEHIGAVLDFGAEVWHFGSDVHPLADLYAKVKDRIIPFGGVNPHGAMRHGTPEEVRAETREVLRTSKGRKLLLSTGTGTTPETSLENQRAMVASALTDDVFHEGQG
jgi:uroporphyrinogen decarboxylase